MTLSRYFAVCLLLSFATSASAVVVSLPLTLADANSQTNRLDFDVTAFGASASDTTDLSGSIDTQIELALTPSDVSVTGIRFQGGAIDASDIDLTFRLFFVPVAGIQGRNLGGRVITTASGFSNVSSGMFPSQDHVVQIDSGSLTGTDLAGDVARDLAAEPIDLTQEGTAEIALTEVSANGNERTYLATLTLPIDASEPIVDPPGTIDVAGTVVATGTFDVTLPLPGDYNDDGVVNIADYTVWRDNLGAAAGALPNDVDGGAIDDSQYATWKANFGSPAPMAGAFAPTSVPEPTTCFLLLTGCALALAGRRR